VASLLLGSPRIVADAIRFSDVGERQSMARVTNGGTHKTKSNGGNGDTHHPDNMEAVTAELLTEMNVIQAALASTQEALAATKQETALANELLDAAGIPEAETIRDRLVWIAKEWFAHHPMGCQDHISPGMRRLLRAAGEGPWMDSRS